LRGVHKVESRAELERVADGVDYSGAQTRSAARVIGKRLVRRRHQSRPLLAS
jgi:hypothetical protein